MRSVPVLCYHRVHRDDDPRMPGVDEHCGHVTLSAFRRQMAALAERGFTIVTHRALADWLCDVETLPPGRVAAIDFDDNRLNVLENALPVMDEYGFKGTVFAISRLAEGRLPHMQVYPAMNWEQLGTLHEQGWVVGAHTATHARLGELFQEPDGPARVEQELTECNDCFDRHLGFRPPHFAYPVGDWNREVEQIVARHYRTARHWQPTEQLQLNREDTNPLRIQSTHVTELMSLDRFDQLLDLASA